jgi:hypothetical protein
VPPPSTHSRSLAPLLTGATERHRDWALYGYWGSTVNITDGVHTYLHPCRGDLPAYLYSTMMMKPYGWFTPPEAQDQAEAGRFLPYTDSPVWRYPAPSRPRHEAPLLYEVQADPWQRTNLWSGLPVEADTRSAAGRLATCAPQPSSQTTGSPLTAPQIDVWRAWRHAPIMGVAPRGATVNRIWMRSVGRRSMAIGQC